ncbi:MAG: ankyrin repeat domain-containing protein [Thermodesulfobacteriota bacterium]
MGLDVNAKPAFGYGTVLMCAARGGHLDVVKMLADKGADVHADEGSDRETALLCAAWSGNLQVVKLLTGKGADVNYDKHVNGWTALFIAAVEMKRDDIAELLKAHGARERTLTPRSMESAPSQLKHRQADK